jgi:hypothetical protein
MIHVSEALNSAAHWQQIGYTGHLTIKAKIFGSLNIPAAKGSIRPYNVKITKSQSFRLMKK